MAEVQKYLFDQQFDAPPPPAPEPVAEEIVPDEPLAPPPPTFSQEDLEAARAQARAEALAEGLRQGRAEALAGQEKLVAQLLDSIALRLAELMTEQAARYSESREMILQIAITIASKLMPATFSRHGTDEIEAAVRTVLAEIGPEPRLVVRVHDSLLDTITLRLQREAEQRGFAGKLVFLGEPTLGVADCRIEWADGGMERDTARLWGDIDRAVAHVLQTGPATPMVPLSGGGDSTTSIES